MSIDDRFSIRSFHLALFDESGEDLVTFRIPVTLAAPFANRLFREVPDIPAAKTLREPWYTLAPRYSDAPPLNRSPLPLGPTSLTGQPYDPGADPGPTVALHPQALVRYFEVRLLDLQDEIYHGEYSVDDIFLHSAHRLLQLAMTRKMIPASSTGTYFYAVGPSTREIRESAPPDFLPEEAYAVEGVFRLPPRFRESPRIQFRPVPHPPFPERDPNELGATFTRGKGSAQAGRVFLPHRLVAELRHNLKLSDRKEEGGYLLGRVYRIPGSPEREDDPAFRWAVEVTDIVMAEDTIGSAALLLFTGDSWSKVSRRLDGEFHGHRLVGWFHTHLFAATDDFGLSGLDQDMHGWYLPKPWQVAILLNLEAGGERTIRCYQRGPQGDLVETPFEVLGE